MGRHHGAEEEIPGTPKWLTLYSPLFDIVAKVPASVVTNGTALYRDDLQAMLRALLVDRFKMKVHYEDRPMDAYTLVAAKPKLKKADPSTRDRMQDGTFAGSAGARGRSTAPRWPIARTSPWRNSRSGFKPSRRATFVTRC